MSQHWGGGLDKEPVLEYEGRLPCHLPHCCVYQPHQVSLRGRAGLKPVPVHEPASETVWHTEITCVDEKYTGILSLCDCS